MSQNHEPSRPVPQDAPLVRPYVSAPPPAPPARPVPAWPQAGPLAFPGPAAGADGPPAAPPSADSPTAPQRPREADRSPARGRRGRRAALAAAVLGSALVGVLLLLPDDAQPEPSRAGPPAELSVPALPARSPDESPAATAGSPAPRPAPDRPQASPSAGATRDPRPSAEAAAPTAGPSADRETLRMGDSGPEVRALQQMLYGQGFTYVSVTGIYDGQTKRGVGQLQRDRSIKGDPQGVYGPATRAAME
ncbi:peptidoglycan-binding domain-containing protein [Streptomyces manipurensis]|uniref:peptidoglycan-binding domain-containing protein n=1 Tax=Streptomyces manipurensis TaxID=1077945 RepID=UPI003C6F7879